MTAPDQSQNQDQNQDFSTFGLMPPLLSALDKAGHKRPSAIQARAIPLILEGRDVLAIAQTGSGKTASYALPLLQRLATLPPSERIPGAPMALVLAPTRELASQIAGVFRQLGRTMTLRTRVACGGLPKDAQIAAMAEGVDILVATSGRLLELFDNGHVTFDKLRFFVLDEADRMLEGDFLIDMERMEPLLPTIRQTILCSATQPPGLQPLAQRLLHKPVLIEIEAQTVTPRRIRQRAMFVEADQKPALIAAALRHQPGRAIVFARTKADVEKLAATLRRMKIAVETLHGDRTQGQRNRALEAFRAGKISALIATDIAARGLDIGDILLVINATLPEQADTYVHRIGRTGRAGKRGDSLTLCDATERKMLRLIEKQIGHRMTIISPEQIAGIS